MSINIRSVAKLEKHNKYLLSNKINLYITSKVIEGIYFRKGRISMFFTKKHNLYKKFNDKRIELTIDARIVDTIIFAGGLFNSYLKKELKDTDSQALRNDIKRMEHVLKELGKLENMSNIEGNSIVSITIAEFLIFKYELDNVAKLVMPLVLQDSITIGYYDFLIYLEEKYNCLYIKEIESNGFFAFVGYLYFKERM